jgi:hypothetical protein
MEHEPPRVQHNVGLYRVSHEERSIFWEVITSAILSKTMYMYMCSIPNGFRGRAISLYISKIVDKKEYKYKEYMTMGAGHTKGFRDTATLR